MAFTGFSDDGRAFLAALPTRDRDWFAAHKPEYTAEVADPAKDFVVAVGTGLQERVSPLLVAEPKTNGSISPINNDLRFNPDRAPYKDHLLFHFWEGPDKKRAPTLHIRFGADETGFAAGMRLDQPELDRWRTAVAADSGAELAEALDRLREERGAEVVGEGLKRVPKPYDGDHPRADLLRHKGLQVRWLRPNPPSVASAAFVGWCVDELERGVAVHRWLVDHVAR